MVSFAKKVHFDKDGSGNITQVIYQTTLENQPTKKELCGDTAATMSGLKTDDPDFCTLAYMRHLRLRQFREKAMKRRNEIWRTNQEKMVDAFTLLRLHYKGLKCTVCQKEFLWGELTPLNDWYLHMMISAPSVIIMIFSIKVSFAPNSLPLTKISILLHFFIR